jgi:hypothetical protein
MSLYSNRCLIFIAHFEQCYRVKLPGPDELGQMRGESDVHIVRLEVPSDCEMKLIVCFTFQVLEQSSIFDV